GARPVRQEAPRPRRDQPGGRRRGSRQDCICPREWGGRDLADGSSLPPAGRADRPPAACVRLRLCLFDPRSSSPPSFLPGRFSLNDTLFYPKARKGCDNLLARRLNSSYHQSVFPSDCGFNGGRYALPELRSRIFGKTNILPRVWIESGALCAITRGTATGWGR